LAQSAVGAGERAGLLLYAQKPLAAVPPGRGWATLARVRAVLEGVSTCAVPADPVAAALAIRRLLRQASLIVLLTDLDDASGEDALAQVPRVLGAPHRLIIAGAQEPRIARLASLEAREPDDPWIALAAQEHLQRARTLQRRLRQLGCRVVSAPAQQLEQAVLAEHAALRWKAPA
jgi:uncharacterized protein (DUF58 family)